MHILKKIGVALGIAGLIVSVNLPSVIAQQQQTGSSGLSISPTRNELVLEPGKLETVRITVRNISGVDITVKATVNDFEADGDTGQPRFIVDPKRKSSSSIRPFLSEIADFDLSKDEKKNVDIPIQVPSNASPGAYYGALRYSAVPKDRGAVPKGESVALTASVASLVLIEVPGNITEQIQVQSLRILRENKPGSYFYKAPDKVILDIKNKGNSFSKPFGRVIVSKGGSKKEVYSYELNKSDPKSNILPGSSRKFTDKIENIKAPGHYTVTANISQGKSGEILTYSNSFWYVPTAFLIAIGSIIVVIIIAGYVLYRRRFGRGRSNKKKI